MNKSYLDDKLFKKGHLSKIEKDYSEYNLQYNKQSVEILIQRAVKTTIQTLYDKCFFVNFANVEKILEDFLFYTKRRADLEEVNDDIQ